jgi:hypothetical protein
MTIFIMDIPAIIFASAAGYMAVNSIDGFGWMILASVLCCVNNVKSVASELQELPEDQK